MVVPAARYVPYYSVSTARQGQSSLELEAQRAAMQCFVAYPAQLLTEYVEIERGKQNHWPQLLEAITAAGATLLIAKLNKLLMNVGFNRCYL